LSEQPQITTAKISDLLPYANNAREHTDEQVAQVAASIKEFGWTNPLIVHGTTVVAGHARLAAARKLGMTEVPIIDRSDMSEAQWKAYVLADNQLAQNATWNEGLLSLELDSLAELDFDLDLIGFPDLDELMGDEPEEGLTDPDDVPEPPEEAITQPGDLWILGEHRLLCGDSTDAESVAYLMDGAKADMVFTDPPYNVDYGSTKNPRHKIRKIENDSMGAEEWEKFCKELFKRVQENCAGDVYMWGASGVEGMKMRLWLAEAGCHWSATIIWKKQQLVLSPANYQRMYEPCFYGWFGQKSSFVADRKQTEVWEIDRPLNSKLHPTMKPVELCEKGIKNSSSKNDIVLDFFLGSGSTLIAAQSTGRKCYGLEIDPIYCDVIVKRWEDFTGKKAELHGG